MTPTSPEPSTPAGPGRTLVGAAAAGATASAAAGASPPPPPEPKLEGFRLHAREPVPDGVRRVAREQLEGAASGLREAPPDALGDAVHDARKRIKRVRAVLRLSRDALGDDAYAARNAHLRATAARLSGARDARVLVETLDALVERFAAELPGGATATLRERLVHRRDAAEEDVAADGGRLTEAAAALAEAAARTAEWRLARDGFAALEPGLRRIYRRGRRRLRAAREEPSAERLHDSRKRVKDLWHAAQLLEPADPERMRELAGRAHDLSDTIGDHHDLSVLRDHVELHPGHVPDGTARAALLAVIDRRRDELSEQALELGARLYEQRPKRFVRAVRRAWDERVGEPPPSAAAR